MRANGEQMHRQGQAEQDTLNSEFLWDIMAIMYQVNDYHLVMEMLLDAVSEKYKLKHLAICGQLSTAEAFGVLHRLGFSDTFESDFVFDGMQLPGATGNERTMIREFSVIEGIPGSRNLQNTIPPDIERLLFVPLVFQDKIIAFMVVGLIGQTPESFYALLQRLALMAAPLLNAFDPVQKTANTLENIVAKIIRDRVYEARLSLTPISFSLFRLQFTDELKDTLVFEDVLRVYQDEFKKMLGAAGDLLWLTTDTAFFIYNKADLIETEQLCQDLKSRLQIVSGENELNPAYVLKHACISYPQSGENASEIINNLYLKLFEDIYMMEQ